MSAMLEWPASARLTEAARREISAEHYQRERAAAAARSAQVPETLLARRLAAAEKRIAQLERALADRPNTATIADAVGQALAGLHHALRKEQRPEAVKAMVGAAMSEIHAGTWKAERAYPQGCLTTCSGSLWLAKIDSRGVRPGGGDGCWQLVVKGHHPGKKETAK